MRILSMPVDEGGCGWYRIRQPFQLITGTTDHEAQVLDPKLDGVSMGMALKAAQVCVVRQGGEEGIRQLKKIPDFQHLKWVIDIDDNIELISPYSQHYQEYGVAEFYDKTSKQWVWKDGENGFDHVRNGQRVHSLLQGLREADLVTVTTPKLAEYAQKYNDNVAITPNLIDTAQWWPLGQQEHTRLRVGWNGGVSHYEDWYPIRESLNRVLRQFQFQLVMVGSHYGGLIDQDNRHLVEVRPWVPFAAHSYRMMCLELDAAIIPLADLPFNAYKSPIKLFEFSAMGVPSVVSAVGPYKDALLDVPSLGFTNGASFERQLSYLLTNAAVRHKLGQEAQKRILTRYDAAKQVHCWIDAYSQLLTNKTELATIEKT